MSGTLMPFAPYRLFNAGQLEPGGKLLFEVAGMPGTPQAIYTDAALTTPHTNPVVVDANGEAVVYLSAAAYRLSLKDADDALIRVIDPLTATHLASSALGEVFFFGGDPNSPVSVTTYTSGATVDKLHVGTGIFNIDSASLPSGTYRLEAMLKALASGDEVTAALVNLTDGTPDTPLVAISSTSTVGARVQSGDITFAASGAAKSYGIKTKVTLAGDGGLAWGVRLVRV